MDSNPSRKPAVKQSGSLCFNPLKRFDIGSGFCVVAQRTRRWLCRVAEVAITRAIRFNFNWGCVGDQALSTSCRS